MNTCHGSTISAMTKTMMAVVAITATERAITMIAQRLLRSATIPERKANANIGSQRKTKSRATWKAESVRFKTNRPITTESIQRPVLSNPPAAHIRRKSRSSSRPFTRSSHGRLVCELTLAFDWLSAITYKWIPVSKAIRSRITIMPFSIQGHLK